MKSAKNIIRLVLLLQFFIVVKGSAASCPTDFNYVHQIPWDASYCESGDHNGRCCQSLWSLINIGLGQHLKESSLFQFADHASATACLKQFQQQLSSLPTAAPFPDFVPHCWNNISMFVSSPTMCDGIQTKQDWIELLGTTQIDSSCKGDLSDLTVCSLCFHAAQMVTSRLVGMIKNVTQVTSFNCLRFAVLYSAVVSQLGPKSPITASCVFGLGMSLPKRKDNNRLPLISIFSAAAVVVVSLLVFLFVFLRWAKRNNDTAHRQFVNRIRDLLRETVRPNTGAMWFRIEEIKTATNNFSGANLIGEGGFGTVYKGTLPYGQEVAVKRIRNCSAEWDAAFINEVEIINNIRHRNLMALKGLCVASDDIAGHQLFLIYDHMPNGSLDEHLYGGKLSWPQRENIVLGTARGLAYLHSGIEPAIYHRDIKPTNILLDCEMNARLSDFGLARMMLDEVGESHRTTKVAGTSGYLAPEYALYGQLTDKSDVYSFGVVLLEILSGRKALDTSLESVTDYLITDWAWTLVKAGKVIEVIDESIRDSGDVSIMLRFICVGILCAHVMVSFRPTIAEALKMLEGDFEIPQIPDRPLPLTYRSLSNGNNRT